MHGVGFAVDQGFISGRSPLVRRTFRREGPGDMAHCTLGIITPLQTKQMKVTKKSWSPPSDEFPASAYCASRASAKSRALIGLQRVVPPANIVVVFCVSRGFSCHDD